MKEKWAELITVLNKILSIYTAILTLSQQKKEILVAAKSQDLEKVVKQEEVLILQVGKLEEQRQRLVRDLMEAHGIPEGEASFAKLEEMVMPDVAAELRGEKNTCLTSDIENKAEAACALGHIVVMTYKTLLKLLRSKGFVVEKSFGFGYHPFPPIIAQFLAKIDKSHSHYILVKARKLG